MIAAAKGFTRWAGLVLAVSLPLISTQAHAASVTVNGTAYELGSVFGSYANNTALLQGQLWWGDAVLASEFAAAANNEQRFAYDISGSGSTALVSSILFLNGNMQIASSLQTTSSTFMTATESASSVPEINAGSLSQALLILFALWLVTWRRTSSRVA